MERLIPAVATLAAFQALYGSLSAKLETVVVVCVEDNNAGNPVAAEVLAELAEMLRGLNEVLSVVLNRKKEVEN